MQRDPRAYLWDASNAADAIIRFTDGKTGEEFSVDLMLQSAVERQFQIIGEALNQLARVDSSVVNQIPDLHKIVSFRNILVHGYAIIDNRIVWEAVRDHLPRLREAFQEMLGEP